MKLAEIDIVLAAKVAEYMALARDLRSDSPIEDYRRANCLAWELAMCLPADIFRSIGKALTKRSAECNEHTVAIAVRALLLGDDAGNLTANELISHAPGIGKPKN